MAWFEKKFDNRYSGVKHPYRLGSYPTNPLFSISTTGKIIIANVIFFLIAIILGYRTLVPCSETFCRYIAIQPVTILAGQKLWTLLTHMFMHAGTTHLFMNMISLMFIGSFVEKLLGKKRFIWLYFIGGLVSAIFFVTLAGFFGTTIDGEKLFGNPLTFAVGASGAIFALGGLLAILIPKMKVLVFFIIPMQMWLAMTSFLAVFWVLSYFGGIPIGNSAHLGGLITGLVYGIYLKYKYPKKTMMISRFFS